MDRAASNNLPAYRVAVANRDDSTDARSVFVRAADSATALFEGARALGVSPSDKRYLLCESLPADVDLCDACRRPIGTRAAAAYDSKRGLIWHPGCAPSRNPSALRALIQLREELVHRLIRSRHRRAIGTCAAAEIDRTVEAVGRAFYLATLGAFEQVLDELEAVPPWLRRESWVRAQTAAEQAA